MKISNVALNWMGRRAMEVGGLVGTVFFLYQGLPANSQQALRQVFSGDWEGVQLGALATIGLYLWTQFLSWKATTANQVVQNGEKVRTDKLPAEEKAVAKAKVKEVVVVAKQAAATSKPTLLDRIFNR